MEVTIQARKGMWQMTQFDFTRSLIKQILRHATAYDWSTQGLGMLRLYIEKPQLRLHVWDSSLKVHGVSALHTHPWNFRSTVIAGVMRNTRYKVYEGSGYPSYAFPPEEYNQVTIQCGEKACVESDVRKVPLCEQSAERYTQEMVYNQTHDEIHLSAPEDGTVTLVERVVPEGNSPDHAQIYWRGSGPWVDAKPREATAEEVTRVCDHSLITWF